MKRIRFGEPRVAWAALVYLVVASAVAPVLGTWTDEEYTLATTAHGPSYAAVRAITYELQAPLYFVLEAIWREANVSIWWARLPSILCIAALFIVLGKIARRIAPERDPLAFVLIVGFSPFVVYAGFEIRLYALALVLGGIGWLLFDAGFVSGTDVRARRLLVLTAVLAIYVQYFLAFALVGFGCALVVLRRRRALRDYLLWCAPIVIAALPLAWIAHRQVSGYETIAPPVGWLLRRAALHPWTDFVFPWETDWQSVRHLHLAYDLVVVAMVLAAIAARPRFRRTEVAWIACAIAIELVYLALIAAVRLQLDYRHYVALYVPALAAAYAFVPAIARGPRPRLGACFALAGVLAFAATATEYRALAQPGDWSRVAAYLSARARPGDAIVVYAADAVAPLRRAYRGTIPLVPYPVTPRVDVYSQDTLTLRSQTEAERAFAPLRRFRRLWFVSDVDCRPTAQGYGCAFLGPAIDRLYTTESSRAFFDSTVEELTLRGRERREDAAHA